MSSSQNQTRVVIVTGGTKNIGLGITKHFLNEGANVVTLSRGNHSPDLADSSPDKLELIKADVTRIEDVNAAALQVSRRFGRVDLLINNVGGGCEKEPLLQTNPAWFKSVIDLNVCSTFNTCHAFGRLIIESRGKIFNLSGGGANAAAADGWNLAYSSAKAAVLRFTEALANQLKPFAVEVYAIDPGWVPSEEERNRILTRNQHEELVNPSYLSSPNDAALLINYLANCGSLALSGKVFSVSEDYRSIIETLKTEQNFDAHKLRLNNSNNKLA